MNNTKILRRYSRLLILLAAAVLLIVYFTVPGVNRTVTEAVAVLGSANLDKVAAYIRSFGGWINQKEFQIVWAYFCKFCHKLH